MMMPKVVLLSIMLAYAASTASCAVRYSLNNMLECFYNQNWRSDVNEDTCHMIARLNTARQPTIAEKYFQGLYKELEMAEQVQRDLIKKCVIGVVTAPNGNHSAEHNWTTCGLKFWKNGLPEGRLNKVLMRRYDRKRQADRDQQYFDEITNDVKAVEPCM